MTFSSVLMFARSLVLPKSEKKSSARKSIVGSIICVGLSIIPLVVVLSTTNGMVNGMTDRLIQLDTSHIAVYVAGGIPQTVNLESFSEYADTLSEVEGIKAAYPELNISALAVGKNMRTGIQLRAVQQNIFSENQHFKTLFSVEQGNTSDFENGGIKAAVIGKKMAETLSLKPGDTFRVISTKITGNKTVPKITPFTVSAVVSSGYQELDEFWVFIPIEAAFKNFELKNASFKILLETADAFSPAVVGIQRKLQKLTGRYANVYRWDQINASKFEYFSSTKVMLVFIMMMIVLVASMNISSAIIMLVMERRREIAILKSVGATPKGIGLAFVMAGAVCGFSGLLIGIPCGIFISVNANFFIQLLEKILNGFVKIYIILNHIPAGEISTVKIMNPAYYLQEIPVDIPVSEIILVAVGTIVLSILVSLIPAIKAANEKPLENLRG